MISNDMSVYMRTNEKVLDVYIVPASSFKKKSKIETTCFQMCACVSYRHSILMAIDVV